MTLSRFFKAKLKSNSAQRVIKAVRKSEAGAKGSKERRKAAGESNGPAGFFPPPLFLIFCMPQGSVCCKRTRTLNLYAGSPCFNAKCLQWWIWI